MGAGDCGRAQRLEPHFTRGHAVQQLVAFEEESEVRSQKSGIRMKSMCPYFVLPASRLPLSPGRLGAPARAEPRNRDEL